MNTFIAVIGCYKHDNFNLNYWSTYTSSNENYVIHDDSIVQATLRAAKYCEELTDKINKYSRENFNEYNQHEDEVKYKLLSIYDINELTEIR